MKYLYFTLGVLTGYLFFRPKKREKKNVFDHLSHCYRFAEGWQDQETISKVLSLLKKKKMATHEG